MSDKKDQKDIKNQKDNKDDKDVKKDNKDDKDDDDEIPKPEKNEKEVPEVQDDDNDKITLISKDGEKYTVTRRQARISGLVKETIDGDDKVKEIELSQANKSELKHIVDYMVEHNGTKEPRPERPLKSDKMIEACSMAWDAKFIDLIAEGKDGKENNKEQLVNLINAANYMHIEPLLQLSCAKLTAKYLFHVKDIKEVKKILDEM
jgi:hypothetical protein